MFYLQFVPLEQRRERDKRKMRAIIHESTPRLPQIVKFNIDRYDRNSSQSKLCFGIRDSTEKNKDKELLSVLAGKMQRVKIVCTHCKPRSKKHCSCLLAILFFKLLLQEHRGVKVNHQLSQNHSNYLYGCKDLRETLHNRQRSGVASTPWDKFLLGLVCSEWPSQQLGTVSQPGTSPVGCWSIALHHLYQSEHKVQKMYHQNADNSGKGKLIHQEKAASQL